VALTAAEEAKYALDYGVSWLELSLGAQIEHDRLVAGGYGAPLLAATTWLPSLGVAIRDGSVYLYGVDQSGMHAGIRAMNGRAARTEMKLLGPLAGAHAEVLSAPSRRGFEMFAAFSFADGTVVDEKFDKKSTRASLLIRAQGEAARFNVLAASSQPAEGWSSGQPRRASSMVDSVPAASPGHDPRHIVLIVVRSVMVTSSPAPGTIESRLQHTG
jgi:hypothetical protein